MPIRLLIALLVALTLAACGGESGSGSSDDAHDAQAPPRAPGKPGKRPGNARVPGAPIRVPSIVEVSGLSLDAPNFIRQRIKREFADACGGRLCVRFREDPSQHGHTRCTFIRLDPEPGTTVERWSTITIVTGTDPCDVQTSSPSEQPVETPT